jgi:hypothetical protein
MHKWKPLNKPHHYTIVDWELAKENILRQLLKLQPISSEYTSLKKDTRTLISLCRVADHKISKARREIDILEKAVTLQGIKTYTDYLTIL